MQCLLVDPDSPRTIYAGQWKKGVFKSTDGGATWVNIGGEPPHPDIVQLAIDRSAPGHLLVGTGGGGVWRLDASAVERPRAAAPKKQP